MIIVSPAKTRRLCASILMLGALWGSGAVAEVLEGRLNGLKCASQAQVCPTLFDPKALVELDYVISVSGGHYYFITNIDRETKMRHVLSRVRIEGSLSPSGMKINAEKLWVKEGDDYQLVWSAGPKVTETSPPGAEKLVGD